MKKVFPLFLVLLLFLSGCASMGNGRYSGMLSKETLGNYDADAWAAEEPAAMSKSASPMPASPLRMVQEQPPEKEPEKEPDQDRKRIYSGFFSLIVDSVEQTKNTISAIARREEGFIESIRDNSIIIRVPAARFEQVFNEILSLGDVRRSSVETADVTELYQDVESKLVLARRTRERLYILLEKADDLEDRLKILREIRRLTEEIERLTQTMESLKKQVAYSRIQVELFPRLSEDVSLRERIPFPWLSELNPLYPSIYTLKGRVSLVLSYSFAVFDGDSIYRAESHDGVRIRVGSIRNSPKGDTLFWQKALMHHLSPLFREAQPIDTAEQGSGFLGVLFLSKDRIPYYYYVGVKAQGDILYVAEIFFPEEELKNLHFLELMESIGTLEVKP